MRGLAWRALAVLITLCGIVVSATPASAELTEEQSAPWGIKTELASSTIANWEALGWATEQVGGTMFVGGKFGETTNGSSTYSQPYVAAFDAGDGRFLSWWRPSVNAPVLALEASPDGALFAGGEFTTWNGAWTGNLVKLNPATGVPVAGFATKIFGPDAVIRDIKLESDGWLYVVGRFSYYNTGAGPAPATNVLRLNPTTGVVDSSWLPTTDKAVWGVSTSKTRAEVYLAGWFTTVNGSASARGFAGVSSVTGALLHGRQTIPYNQCVGCLANYRMYDVEATEYGTVFVGGEQHALYILDEASSSTYRSCTTRGAI
ncbi:MAG: delta-60 repeat domain-containing protein [Acidimicrobiales bacterium]